MYLIDSSELRDSCHEMQTSPWIVRFQREAYSAPSELNICLFARDDNCFVLTEILSIDTFLVSLRKDDKPTLKGARREKLQGS